MKNNIVYLVIFILFFLLVSTFYIYYIILSKKSNTTKKNKKIGQTKTKTKSMSYGEPLYKKNVKCNSHNNTPMEDNNGDIFKLYNDYADIREQNVSEMNVPTTNNGGPANIFIIRHAEKMNSLYYLDNNGIYRSTKIPKIIEKINNKGYSIDFIIAPNPNLPDNHIHIQQTAMLTSWLLNIPLFIFGGQADVSLVASNLYTIPNFSGKNVLICWEHTCIQSLLNNILSKGKTAKRLDHYLFKNPLGNSDLPYWDKNNFNSIYHLDNTLKFHVWNEGIKTCYPSNNKITFGKNQTCEAS